MTPQFGLEALACVAGAVLAEAVRPSKTWGRSGVNVGLGVAGGAYGPQGVEIVWDAARRAHLLVTFCCGLLGAIVLTKLLDWASDVKFPDLFSAIGRAVDAFRKKPNGG